MSIQINPYISALQETQKAPVSKTQEKSEAGRFGALLEEKQKQLDTQTVRFPSMRQTGCRKEISVFRKVS